MHLHQRFHFGWDNAGLAVAVSQPTTITMSPCEELAGHTDGTTVFTTGRYLDNLHKLQRGDNARGSDIFFRIVAQFSCKT